MEYESKVLFGHMDKGWFHCAYVFLPKIIVFNLMAGIPNTYILSGGTSPGILEGHISGKERSSARRATCYDSRFPVSGKIGRRKRKCRRGCDAMSRTEAAAFAV
ncbi:unnamed protein product [Cuscuta epithymum]|uniref:Uncharacterized protein n=1 Tax=Cuscuta epithymum TaxID=186058 RepID=A0AAV0EZ45_9ASTE|nr:unnamed protein product [Cuscuta epithymum]